MVTEAPKPPRRREKHQGPVIGTAKELASVVTRVPYSVPRKLIPWERNPFSHLTVGHAIESVQSWLVQQPDSQEVYQQIFGQVSGSRRSHRDRGIKFAGKGWNSITYAFESNGKKWAVKIGSMVSPDGVYFLNPRSARQSDELNNNLQILRQGMEQFRLPDFVAFPQVIHHTKFRNFMGIPEKRAVQIMPYEDIVPLSDVVAEVRKDPALRVRLQDELQRYSQLRRWLVKEHRSDFDLDGLDNVAVVRVARSGGKRKEFDYHLRVLDIGLRIHGLNTPLADVKQDVKGILNSIRLRMAIAGEEPARTRDIVQMLGIYAKALVGSNKQELAGTAEQSDTLKEYILPEIDIMLEGLFVRREIRHKWLDELRREIDQFIGLPENTHTDRRDKKAA